MGYLIFAKSPERVPSNADDDDDVDDVASGKSARGDLPSPRPFFRRARGDPRINAFFLVAMASETTISLNRHSTCRHPVARNNYEGNPIPASMRSIVSVTSAYESSFSLTFIRLWYFRAYYVYYTVILRTLREV